MRVKGGKAPRRAKNRLRKEVEGFWGGRSKLWKTIIQVERRSKQQAFYGRRQKKRDARRLWIERIAAACKMNGTSYSKLIGKMRVKNIVLDRKILADLSVRDPKAFTKVVETAMA